MEKWKGGRAREEGRSQMIIMASRESMNWISPRGRATRVKRTEEKNNAEPTKEKNAFKWENNIPWNPLFGCHILCAECPATLMSFKTFKGKYLKMESTYGGGRWSFFSIMGYDLSSFRTLNWIEGESKHPKQNKRKPSPHFKWYYWSGVCAVQTAHREQLTVSARFFFNF